MIRKTQEADAEAIADLDGELFPNVCWNENTIQKEIKLGWGLVATNDEKVIGFLMVRMDNGMADIIRVGVTKKFQGKGHGRALLQRAIEDLDGPMMLTVRRDNTPARKLYLSEGFLPQSMASEDAIILVRLPA